MAQHSAVRHTRAGGDPLLDYVAEVEHARERIVRLERALDEAVDATPPAMRAVIEALQALRGVAKLTAVTIVAEVGRLSRFARPRQLMGYSGAVASEHSSGPRVRRGAITKTGNAHLRRIVVEAAWSYRHRPAIGPTLRQRQAGQSAEVTGDRLESPTAAARALPTAYGPGQGQAASRSQPSARELLGFIWAIGVAVERYASNPTDERRNRPYIGQAKSTHDAERATVEGPTDRRVLVRSYATGRWPDPRH